MAIHEILGHTVPISANKKSPHVRGSIDSGIRDVCSNFPKMYGWFSWIQAFQVLAVLLYWSVRMF